MRSVRVSAEASAVPEALVAAVVYMPCLQKVFRGKKALDAAGRGKTRTNPITPSDGVCWLKEPGGRSLDCEDGWPLMRWRIEDPKREGQARCRIARS